MSDIKNKIVEILVSKGNNLFNQPYKLIPFTKNRESNELLNNFEEYPHAFVLVCIMNRQIKTERA